MNGHDGKSVKQRILGSALYQTGVSFTGKEMQIEIGGKLNGVSVALRAMALDGELRQTGTHRYAKFEPHWINTGTLAGANRVRCPQ